MEILLIVGVALLSFANGSNDNFKGVATLWGARRTSYHKALVWATTSTFLGSLLAVGLATSLAAKFNGSALVARDIYTQMPFLAAVALGAAGAVPPAASSASAGWAAAKPTGGACAKLFFPGWPRCRWARPWRHFRTGC